MYLIIKNEGIGQYISSEYNEKNNTITYRKLNLSTNGIKYFPKANIDSTYDLIYDISDGLAILIYLADSHKF